jgi:hypothetical protein
MSRLAAVVLLALVGCSSPATPAPVPTIAVVPSPSAAPALAEPIMRTGQGTGRTAPFALPGGTYQILWSARDSLGVPCAFTASLRSASDPAYRVIVADVLTNRGVEKTDGEGWAYNVPAGQYYFDVGGTCQWAAGIATG